MPREFNISAIPQWLLWKCFELHLTAKEVEQAITTGRFFHREEARCLAKYLFLRSRNLTYNEWDHDRIGEMISSTYKHLPDYKDMVELSHQEAIAVLSCEMQFSDYFTARKSGLTHSELVKAYTLHDGHLDLASYSKLRQKHKLSIQKVQEIMKSGVYLSDYCELLDLKLDDTIFTTVLELFGKNLGQYLLAHTTHKVELATLIARVQSKPSFDIYRYNRLRSHNRLSDEKALQVLSDPELLAAIRS